MGGLGKAFAYLIAAHVQAISIVMMAWWLGTKMNIWYPIGFNWLFVSIPCGILGMAQTFYLIIRNLMWQKKVAEAQNAAKEQK
jgi:hypothetical protein